MRSRITPRVFAVIYLVLCLLGCGGSSKSSSQPPPVITTATLPTATVGVAYSQTMAARGVQPLTWSISSGNLPAGLTVSIAGVISGTPTGTPGTAKFTVTVADAENPPAKATANLSIVVNSAATALFQGNYAFLFSGYFNGYFTGAGSFVADGAGNITGGIVDTNGLTGPTINGGFTGTYSIGSNSMGTMNWVFTGPGGGSSTYEVVISSDGGNAQFIQYDSRGVQGAGVIKKQDTSSFSAAQIKGNYAFGLVGIDGPTAGRMAVAGEFLSDGVSQLSSGLADDNDNGTLLSSAGLSGSYSVASSGRGTAVLNISGLGTLNASFYVISANEFFLMETDTVGASHPLLSGDVLQQSGAGSFTDASLNGSSILEADALASSNPPTPSVTLGLAVVSIPGTLNLNSDVNSGGTLSNSTEQLTYSVAPDGRVSTTGSAPAVFYLVNANQAFALFSDSAVTFGSLEPQTAGPFTNASLSGTYVGNSIILAAPGTTEADALSADGHGNLTETFNSSDGTHLQQGTRSLTYATAANGRTVLSTAQNSAAGIVYIVSPLKAIELGAGNPSLSIFEH